MYHMTASNMKPHHMKVVEELHSIPGISVIMNACGNPIIVE